jgi:hypothetical protein
MTPIAAAPSRSTGLATPTVAGLIVWNLILGVLAFARATESQSDGRTMAWTLFTLATTSLLAMVAAAVGTLLVAHGDGGPAIALTGLRVQCCLAFLHLLPAAITVGPVVGIGAAAVMVGGWAVLPRVTAELADAAESSRRRHPTA